MSLQAAPTHTNTTFSFHAASQEVARVRRHILGAIDVIAHANAPKTRRRQRARARLVKSLEKYVAAGRFPINRDFPFAKMPYFVDASETRCALAHLVEEHDGRSLVDAVASAPGSNNGFVRELLTANATAAGLHEWLLEMGLSPEEAARIQPSYCFTSASCVCVNSETAIGVLEADGISTGGTVRVTKIHGVAPTIHVGDEVSGSGVVSCNGANLSGKAIVMAYGVSKDSTDRPSLQTRCLDQQTSPQIVCGAMNEGIPAPGVPKDLAIRAILTGSGCTNALAKANPRYVSRQHCKGGDMTMASTSSEQQPQQETPATPTPITTLASAGAPISIASVALVILINRRFR